MPPAWLFGSLGAGASTPQPLPPLPRLYRSPRAARVSSALPGFAPLRQTGFLLCRRLLPLPGFASAALSSALLAPFPPIFLSLASSRALFFIVGVSSGCSPLCMTQVFANCSTYRPPSPSPRKKIAICSSQRVGLAPLPSFSLVALAVSIGGRGATDGAKRCARPLVSSEDECQRPPVGAFWPA